MVRHIVGLSELVFIIKIFVQLFPEYLSLSNTPFHISVGLGLIGDSKNKEPRRWTHIRGTVPVCTKAHIKKCTTPFQINDEPLGSFGVSKIKKYMDK